MTSREQPNSSGVRRWLHPNSKGSRTDEHRASLTARQVKEVPVDASLLKGGPKNYGTHRVRRKGLPTHVPPSWLVPHPSDGSLDQHTMGKQGQEEFMIKAECYRGSPHSAAKLPPAKSHSSPAQGSWHYSSTYSNVFPHRDTARPEPIEELRNPPAPVEAPSAHGESLQEAKLTGPQSPSRAPSPQSRAKLSTRTSAMDSSQEAAQQQSSVELDSFAFPELSSAVRSFASVPLKRLRQLPAAACSRPGPLEESLLRREQDSPGLEEPGPAAGDAQSVSKAGSMARSCDPASAAKLGPNFQRLVASFQERKAQRTPEHSGSTYSNPVFEATTLSDSLQALKARSAGAADSSSRRVSEDSLSSTGATKHPSFSHTPRLLGHPTQNITGSGYGLTGSAPVACAEQAHQAGSVSSTHGEAASVLSGVSKPAASARLRGHVGQGSQALQLAGAATGALTGQAMRAHDGRTSEFVSRAATSSATVRGRATPIALGEASAACLVTPADLSAEIAEQAISRQLRIILGMLCAAAALSLTCSFLLMWRLFTIANHTSQSGDQQLAGNNEGTNYASLTPAWWPL